MKKVAIFSITAFYLLLTTGMFVCIVHCAAENFTPKPAMQMAIAAHHAVKGCSSTKEGDCCKKHGNYSIKENIKPSSNLQYASIAVLANKFATVGFIVYYPIFKHTYQESNSPPGRSGKYITIKNCSFLI